MARIPTPHIHVDVSYQTSKLPLTEPWLEYEYAATVWDPYQQSHIKSLENVQRNAATFLNGNYYNRTPGCVISMVKELQWKT